MKELSLHILDIVQNSLSAGASLVDIEIDEQPQNGDYLKIVIIDNGRGMEKEKVAKVLDPFFTTRTTRKVGLGLPLFQQNATHCDGSFEIESNLGSGTTVRAKFKHSHWDRPPLGDMSATLLTLIVLNPDVDFHYIHRLEGNHFELDTRDVRRELGDEIPLNNPVVVDFLREFIGENYSNLTGGEMK